jgi:hypothetical protein
MEVTRRIQVRNRASSCRPGLGLGGWCKTGREGSAAVGTVSGLTPRGQGGGRLVAQWAARAGPPFPVRRLAGGPLRRWNSPRATNKMVRPAGGLRYEVAKPNEVRSDRQLDYCASAGRERKMSENRPTAV